MGHRYWPAAAASAPVTRFDAATFPTHFGGEIRQLDLEPYMSTKDARRMDAFMQYGVVAGMQAMRDSGLVVTESNADRIGIMMGSGMGGLESIEEAYDKYLETQFTEESVAVFHSGQHHQSGQRALVDRVQDHRAESCGGHGLHHLDARARARDAADSVRRCRRRAGGRVGNGHLRHRDERFRPGQGPVTAQ